MQYILACFEVYTEPSGTIQSRDIPHYSRCVYTIGPVDGADVNVSVTIRGLRPSGPKDECIDEYIRVSTTMMTSARLMG